MIGHIGTVIENELIEQEKFSGFQTGPESNWVELLGVSPGVWNCTKRASPDDNHIFDKTICRWVPIEQQPV